MLDDSWRMDCWSLDSNGKEGVSVKFREDRKTPEKYGNLLFYLRTKEAKRRGEEGLQGAHTPLGAGPPDPAPMAGVAHLPGLRLRPFAYIFHTEP